MYKMRKGQELTSELVLAYLENYQTKVNEFNKDLDYYKGKQDIAYRHNEDPLKPNNRITHAYASTIVDRYAGYFMGEPVSYKENSGAELDKLNLISVYNDEPQHNLELAKGMGIYGIAYELFYIDEIGQFRFKYIDPQEMFVIADDTLDEELRYAVRFVRCEDILKKDVYYMVDVYNQSTIATYKVNELMSAIEFVEEAPHNLSLVPVAIYRNNKEELNDFTRVKELIDAYDRLDSDRLNDIEAIADSYLALYGVGAIGGSDYFSGEETSNSDAIYDMRKNKVLMFNDKDAKAEFLTKAPNGADAETLAIRLVSEIHKQSGVPEDFEKAIGGATSGQALKMLMKPMEDRTAIKESNFRRGLYRRLELINGYLKMFNVGAFNAITPVFTRNLPTSSMDSVDDLVKLVQTGIISTETAMGQIPFVEDITKELEKVREEKEVSYDSFSPLPIDEQESI